jgi:hypothetical protein
MLEQQNHQYFSCFRTLLLSQLLLSLIVCQTVCITFITVTLLIVQKSVWMSCQGTEPWVLPKSCRYSPPLCSALCLKDSEMEWTICLLDTMWDVGSVCELKENISSSSFKYACKKLTLAAVHCTETCGPWIMASRIAVSTALPVITQNCLTAAVIQVVSCNNVP